MCMHLRTDFQNTWGKSSKTRRRKRQKTIIVRDTSVIKLTEIAKYNRPE